MKLSKSDFKWVYKSISLNFGSLIWWETNKHLTQGFEAMVALVQK